MKKWFAALLALIMLTACAASLAEEAAEQALTLEDAKHLYDEYTNGITDPENGTDYMVGTVEYGLLDPVDVDPSEYLDGLRKAEIVEAGIDEAPEGEYVFLNFPDRAQFDFFQGEAEKNYIRITLFGEPEKSILVRAVFPDDFYMTISGLVQMWANELANVNGIPMEEEDGTLLQIPETGWLRDSVDGAVWMDDRASLRIIPEDDGYKVLILWASSADETTEWTYGCYYDTEEDRLTAVHMVCDNVFTDENGEETRKEMMDMDCETVFAPDDEGRLVITDAVDAALEGKAFTMMPAETEEDGGLHADIQQVADSPEWVANLPAAQDADQLFVVAGIGMDRTTAFISMHQKDENGTWKQILSTPGFVGKNGLCADADHREGCAQTPIGVYRFNRAFGIAADPGCVIPYVRVDENTYWSGDPDRQYNQMVDIRDVPDLVMDDSEHIVDYEYQYQYCLNISFNEEGTAGRGSAIFLHCFGPMKPWTGGCVAVPENIMKLIMKSVRVDCVVVIDTAENLGISF